MNLNWKSIMATVADDDRFYMDTEEDEVTEKEAGWSFLRMFGADESGDDESSQGEDSDFGVNGNESSEEEEEEEEFDEESEEESDFDADEELEEQGMDWEDMEREAIADDRRKKNRRDDDDDEPRRGRKKRTRRR